jgi:hypothetical protein
MTQVAQDVIRSFELRTVICTHMKRCIYRCYSKLAHYMFIANWYILVFGTANNDLKFQLCDLHYSRIHVTVMLPCIQHYLYQIHVLIIFLYGFTTITKPYFERGACIFKNELYLVCVLYIQSILVVIEHNQAHKPGDTRQQCVKMT